MNGARVIFVAHRTVIGAKFCALHKHSSTSTTWIKNIALNGLKHFNKQLYHTARSVKIPPSFAFCQCKLAKKVFKYSTKNILTLNFGFAQCNYSYKVNQST